MTAIEVVIRDVSSFYSVISLLWERCQRVIVVNCHGWQQCVVTMRLRWLETFEFLEHGKTKKKIIIIKNLLFYTGFVYFSNSILT